VQGDQTYPMDLTYFAFPSPPPREHTRAFDLIGYDSVNAWVQGHNLKTNAQPLGKLRVENAPPRDDFKR
jgi:hypothetical protein